MRMAHLGSDIDLECSESDRLFSDGIKEIADWINLPGNGQEMVRVYMNVSLEKYFHSESPRVFRIFVSGMY